MVKVGIEDVSEPHSYSEYTFLQCFLREPPIKEYQSNSTTYYYIFLLIIIELRKRGEKEREREREREGTAYMEVIFSGKEASEAVSFYVPWDRAMG